MSVENEIAGTAEKSSADVIRAQLLGRITRGELSPGERLNEKQIAQEFNVSRGPVREALRSLEEARLVSSVHNKGVFVRFLSIEEILHLYDIRAGLARLCGKLLAQRVTVEQVAELNEVYRHMEAEAAAQNTERYFALNETFHDRLIQFTGNPRLVEIHKGIDRELRHVLRQAVVASSHLRASNAEHRGIIDAITSGDPERAAIALEAHVMNGKLRSLDNMIVRGARAL